MRSINMPQGLGINISGMGFCMQLHLMHFSILMGTSDVADEHKTLKLDAGSGSSAEAPIKASE